MPRKPIGDRAMTSGQRSLRQRQREKQTLAALTSALQTCAAVIDEALVVEVDPDGVARAEAALREVEQAFDLLHRTH